MTWSAALIRLGGREMARGLCRRDFLSALGASFAVPRWLPPQPEQWGERSPGYRVGLVSDRGEVVQAVRVGSLDEYVEFPEARQDFVCDALAVAGPGIRGVEIVPLDWAPTVRPGNRILIPGGWGPA